MTRDTQIPLFLWIATAVVAHLLWGGGADRVAEVVAEKVEIREFAASVRRFVRGEHKPIEVALLEDTSEPEKTDPAAPPEPEHAPAPPDSKSSEEDEAPPAEPKPEKKADKQPEPKQEPEKPKPEPPKPELKPEEKKVEELPTPEELQRKVAVKQHVEDPDQADNPNAEFIGDQANHVKEQTQARITSTDQDDPAPTPGAAAQSSKDQGDPGNSDTTRVAQSEDRPGEKDKAPGVKPAPTELRITKAPAAAPTAASEGTPARQEGSKVASRASTSTARLPAQAGAEAQPALKAAEAAPDALDSAQGSWQIAGERAASVEQEGRQARKKRSLPPLRSSSATDLLGLGGTGRTPGGVNLNLTPEVAVAAIGRDTLQRELRADGERRRSQHAGRWRPVGIERWRAAIENYVSSVKPGNQTALNTARVPFASYLNQIHSRIHPIFAETFLESLDDLPASHPMNRPGITTNLEIVLDRDEGRIQKMGITKTSGVTAFDVAALESVHRAQPFGAPPREIISPDGNVYFHWEFHRNREEACSTYFARPFILKVQPKSAPPPTPKPETPPDSEAPERHGNLAAPARKTLAFAHAP
jgi:outer membrane biosynthesis protein TonB